MTKRVRSDDRSATGDSDWKARVEHAWLKQLVSTEGEWRAVNDDVCEWRAKTSTVCLSVARVVDFARALLSDGTPAAAGLQHVGFVMSAAADAKQDGAMQLAVRASRRRTDWQVGGAPHLALSMLTRKPVVKVAGLLADRDGASDIPARDWARLADIVHLVTLLLGSSAPLDLKAHVAPPTKGEPYRLVIKGFVRLDLEHLLTLLRQYGFDIEDVTLSAEAVTLHVAPDKLLHVWVASGVHSVTREDMDDYAVVPPALKRPRHTAAAGAGSAQETNDDQWVTVSMDTM